MSAGNEHTYQCYLGDIAGRAAPVHSPCLPLFADRFAKRIVPAARVLYEEACCDEMGAVSENSPVSPAAGSAVCDA